MMYFPEMFGSSSSSFFFSSSCAYLQKEVAHATRDPECDEVRRHAAHLPFDVRHHPQLRQESERLHVQARGPERIEEEALVEPAVHKARENNARRDHRDDRETVVLLLERVHVRLVYAVQQMY